MTAIKSKLPDILCVCSFLYLLSHLLCMTLASNCWGHGCLTSLVDVTDFLDPAWIFLDGLALPILQLCACGALSKARNPVPGEKVDPLGFGALLCLFLFSVVYMISTMVLGLWMGNWNLHKVALLIFLTTGIMTLTTAVLGTMRRTPYEKTSGSRLLNSLDGVNMGTLASNCWGHGCLTSLVDVTDFLDPAWIFLDGLALPILQLCACGALSKARNPVPGEKVDPLGFGALLCLFLFSVVYMISTMVLGLWMGNWNLHKVALLIFLTTGIMTLTTAVLGTMRRTPYEKTSGSRLLNSLDGVNMGVNVQNANNIDNLVVHSARMV